MVCALCFHIFQYKTGLKALTQQIGPDVAYVCNGPFPFSREHDTQTQRQSGPIIIIIRQEDFRPVASVFSRDIAISGDSKFVVNCNTDIITSPIKRLLQFRACILLVRSSRTLDLCLKSHDPFGRMCMDSAQIGRTPR